MQAILSATLGDYSCEIQIRAYDKVHRKKPDRVVKTFAGSSRIPGDPLPPDVVVVPKNPNDIYGLSSLVGKNHVQFRVKDDEKGVNWSFSGFVTAIRQPLRIKSKNTW